MDRLLQSVHFGLWGDDARERIRCPYELAAVISAQLRQRGLEVRLQAELNERGNGSSRSSMTGAWRSIPMHMLQCGQKRQHL
ncbi:MAG: hypothetical protein ACLVJ6_01460 [Merdibacter sp.]